tara:strand:- start:327 stop:458 length:132 start_codon:yes stop_codon:yes gene_type:complete
VEHLQLEVVEQVLHPHLLLPEQVEQVVQVVVVQVVLKLIHVKL